MKIFRRRGKSFTGLFIKTFFVSIIAVIISLIVFIGLLFNNFWSFLTDNFYTDTDIAIYGADTLPENYKDLDQEYVLKNNGWIEVLKNNKVVDVIGHKLDNIAMYNSNLITLMKENGDLHVGNILEPIGKDYSAKVYDEEVKYTYLVKIPKFPALVENYIDKGLLLDVTTKEYKEFEKTTIKVIIIPILCGILSFILIMGMHILLAIKSIKKPLEKIENGIDEFSKGNIETKIDFYSYRELNKIKDNFNNMIEKVGKSDKERLKVEESKKNMIRDISHDIKTPITSILGYSQAIIEKENMTESERDTYLGYIHKKTIRVNYLINELFKFVELDTPSYKLNIIKRDYIEFVREVVLIHYKDIEDKNIILQLDFGEKEIQLEFDDKNMERALSNLIVNAIKYNDEETDLKITVKEESDKVVTIVEDNGIGIDKSISCDIFNEFVRGDKSRNSKGGSGLGLSITKKIIELHKGSISLESNIGEGSKFVIEIPKI